MMERLPEGKSLGWMQAPPTWISSHTVRFIGLVRVVIQDGEGFILIKKGKPLIHYFKHGTIELKGHSALDYFNSHPILEFNLCKYTPEEFALALKLCNIGEHEPEIPKEPDISYPAITEQTLPSLHEHAPVPALILEKGLPDKVIFSHEAHTFEERPVVPKPVVFDEPDLKIISQIKNLNGIVAISVFNNKRNVIMMGDADSEPLLKIARNMLATAKKITPLLNWGPFIHMTIQIPEGNMIIAPYHDNYICLLTTRTINIGHIRRILRDLQQREAP
jgi:predicted regulator of Ras-like GTPase activity (Roadblock/LC7/MglB family)